MTPDEERDIVNDDLRRLRRDLDEANRRRIRWEHSVNREIAVLERRLVELERERETGS
jgi:hypothetical protein